MARRNRPVFNKDISNERAKLCSALVKFTQPYKDQPGGGHDLMEEPIIIIIMILHDAL